MSILSFDIGIKNLCYCQLSSEKQIEDWKIINISNDKPCEHILRNKSKCCKPATFKNKDIFLCTSHSKNKSYLNIKKFKNKENSLFHISQNLVKELDKLNIGERNIKDILIENQPALKNPTMKSIQMIVYSYFLIHGICNENSNIEKLEMINARNKLKVYDGPPIECDIKEKYKRNKWLAVKYCDYMIKNDKDIFIKQFNESKKKDDLSDSYLQGIYYICK